MFLCKSIRIYGQFEILPELRIAANMNAKCTYTTLLCLMALIAVSSCKKQEAAPAAEPAYKEILVVPEVMDTLYVDSPHITAFLQKYPMFKYHAEELFTFYEHRDHHAAWFNNYGIIEQAGHFIEQLEHFDAEGMRDSIVYYSAIRALFSSVAEPGFTYAGKTDQLRELELLLSAEFFVYAQKVWYGLNEKTTRSLDWYIKRKTVPSVSILDSILSGVNTDFTRFEPIYQQYSLLREALKKYRALSAAPWDSIYLPEGIRAIRPGESYPVICDIKNRLLLLGDLTRNDSSEFYDSVTMIGVQLFQDRHGLAADGVMGEKFFREINCTPTDRAKQIAINMERYRWLPQVPEGNYIMVNIPEYTMRIYAADTLAWQMRVVVGKASTGTTIFNDELEYIVFSPYWIPPASILNNEILPALKNDPTYLRKENMEAFNPITGKVIDVSQVDWKKYNTMPYSLRQRPGASCALGWVKFLFPNEHSIYFHDTPSRELFQREARGFSHGCIRLEKPKELAYYLLRNDTTYTREKIDSFYYSGKETFVQLKEKVPVFIVYFTARADVDGRIHFSRDIYGHDVRLQQTLFEEGK